MRMTSVGFAVSIALLVVTTSVGGPQQPAAPERAQLGQLLAPQVKSTIEDEKEIAGLAKASKPELLTWERVYALAMVRARAGPGALLQTLDPAALERQADRLGVADFARFRKEFFADGVFRDPAPDLFALLGLLQAIENTRRRLALLENLTALFKERVQDPSSGLSRLDIDTVLVALVKAGQMLDQQKRRFHDGLDEFKVATGLSPQAAVILDRKAIAGFQDVFDSVANWERQPDRDLGRLTLVIAQLPALGNVNFDGQPLLGPIDASPDHWEEVLSKAARLAVAKRADAANAAAVDEARTRLELQARRRVRHLIELRSAYEDTKRGYSLAVGIKDQAFERLHAPPSDGGPQRSLLLDRFLEQVASVTTSEDHLVELWTTFRAERLALCRDLGVLPHADWKTFYAELGAQRTGVEGVRSN
jgi:hypothetical protein